MTPEYWRKIEDIFQAALDCPNDGAREELLRAECGEDPDLRREVEKLIARYETEESFLESPVWTDSVMMQPSLKQQIVGSLEEEIPPVRENQMLIGRQLGAYRLTEEIGKGGMGVVYAAERADGEFRQKVAVKLIKRGMDTDFIVKRFRHERQIAANLSHPNIARLLDGGTTSDNLPYFVMEFVEGEPFFKYCETKRLDLRQKLRLFLQVCQAVIYAHGKQIIHRDIKPGNILVTEDGEPKLLDFGIAKILDPDLIHESVMPTATQMRLMTPEYASPEQVRGDKITTASDQYSLGVLLYELLTGARPYKFPSRAPHEIARIICEELPIELSSGEFGEIQSGDFVLDRDVCRKLDRIVLKALRKNPSERYASIKDFAADLERFLRNEPVEAESFADVDEIKLPAAKTQILQPKSIAVLPLKILSAGAVSGGSPAADDRFLSVGLADALITRLSNVQQFVVRPTSSVLRYGTADLDSFAAGEDLEVEFVLDGNVIKTETRIRVSVQLLNVQKRSIVWAERFDEDLTDVLTLEDVISMKVAESIVPQLTTGELQNLAKRGTDDAKAYEAYLRGRYHWNTFTENSFAQAFVAYHEAIAHDPDYALAYVGIADYYIWLGVYGVVPPKDCYPLAKKAALRAIEIDGKLAEAYASLGFARLCGDFDWSEAEKNLIRAVELNPNYAAARLWYSYLLQTVGRFDEAIAQAERAIKLDPLTYTNYHVLAWAYYFARRFDRAAEQVARNVRKFSDIGLAHMTQSWILRGTGRAAEALHSSEKAVQLSGESLFVSLGHAQALAAAGRRAEAESIIGRAEKQAEKQYLSYYQVALVYCYASDRAKALDALERAFADDEGWLIWLRVEPALDILRDEPRFVEILDKIQSLNNTTKIYSESKRITSNTISVADTKPVPAAEKIAGSRWSGIKQGVFLLIVSFVLLPIFLLLMSTIEIVDPVHLLLAFFVVFGGGIIRICYALFFEPKIASPNHAEELHEADNGKSLQLERSRRRAKPLKYVLATITLVIIAFISYEIVSHTTIDLSATPPSERWKTAFASTMNIKRLTTSGKATRAILSPDGVRIAYVVDEAGRQSLWIRPVDSENARQLVAPDAMFYTEFNFSPDGQFIYYLVSRMPARTLYRVSVNGGAPVKVSENAYNLFAFSPDGRRIVYDYTNPDNNQRSLFIAELDDKSVIKSAQTLFVLDLPNYFPGGLAFSPDGKKIVYSRSTIVENKEVVNLFVYDLETRANEKLGARDFDSISATAWRLNGEEIVISASEKDSAPYQLWLVSYPSGDVSRLTNDFTNYMGVSLTADSSALVTAKLDSVSNLWIAELAASNQNYESKVKQLTNGVDRQDGISGVNWTKDGRILYVAGAGAERNIALMDADGSNHHVIPTGAIDPSFPSLTSDNRYLVYADEKEQELNVWRFDTTSNTLVQLTSRYAVTPALSPDNRSIVYASLPDALSNSLTIHSKSLNGGEEIKLTDATSVRPVVSPDNRFIACNYAGEETNKTWQIAILPVDATNAAPRFIEPYTNSFFRNPQQRPLAWSPDGRFLYFLNNANNVANVFRANTDGSDKPEQLTHFTSGEIFDFALSSDGKRVLLARGSTSSDIVIFRSSK